MAQRVRRVPVNSDDHDEVKKSNISIVISAIESNIWLTGYLGMTDPSLREPDMIGEKLGYLGRQIHFVNFTVGVYDQSSGRDSRGIAERIRDRGFSFLPVKIGEYIRLVDISCLNAVYFDYNSTLGGSKSTGVYPLEDISEFLRRTGKTRIVLAVTFCLRDRRLPGRTHEEVLEIGYDSLEEVVEERNWFVRKIVKKYKYKANMAFVCLVLKKRTL